MEKKKICKCKTKGCRNNTKDYNSLCAKCKIAKKRYGSVYGKQPIVITCRTCEKRFKNKRDSTKFCSEICYRKNPKNRIRQTQYQAQYKKKSRKMTCKTKECNNTKSIKGLCNKCHMAKVRYGSVHGKKRVTITCKTCGKKFKTKRDASKFCTPKCYRDDPGNKIKQAHYHEKFMKKKYLHGCTNLN